MLHRRDNCRLCGNKALTQVLCLTPTPPANAFVGADSLHEAQPCFPLDVFFCDDCGHVQLCDVVDPGVLFENYVYVSGTSPSFIRHFEAYAQAVMALSPASDTGLVVDIGSNDGTLLKFFKAAGCPVLGIDPARKIARQATKDGIETRPEFFTLAGAEAIRKDRGPATVITANNVFAHADDLDEIALGVRHLLCESGVFVFEVSYLLDVMEKSLFDTIYHEHLAYHTVKPLKRFLAKHGLDLFLGQRIDTHGGSLRAYVQHQGGPHKADGSVDALIELEQDRGLDRAETFTEFAAQIDALKERLGNMLRGLRSNGNTIAGFGAPAKATTLMYHFDLGPDIISFIVDDSPLKQGLFSPGMHIPVLPGNALYERRPDYTIILAWNFAEAIIRNHTEYQTGGGHFIVPLPELTIR